MLQKWITENLSKILVWLGTLILGAALGILCYARWSKPVTKEIRVEVPVKIAGPSNADAPEKRVSDTVVPGVDHKAQPVAPNLPVINPTYTTVATVKVPEAETVKVFYQNKLNYQAGDDSIKMWIDGRVWVTDQSGKTLPGVDAQTSFSNDQTVTVPYKTKILVRMPPSHPWALGVSYQPTPRAVGIWGERDFAFVRLGLDVDHYKVPIVGFPDTTVKFRLGLVF